MNGLARFRQIIALNHAKRKEERSRLVLAAAVCVQPAQKKGLKREGKAPMRLGGMQAVFQDIPLIHAAN